MVRRSRRRSGIRRAKAAAVVCIGGVVRNGRLHQRSSLAHVKQSGMPQGSAAKIAACGALLSRIQARRRGEAE
jgi:hypothetical protein